MFKLLVGQIVSSAHTLFDIGFRANFLKFPASFLLWYPNIFTYILLCSGRDIKQTARTCILLTLEENGREHHTSCTLLGIISLLHAVHTSSGYLDLFYVHSTDQITVRLLRDYKLQVLWHCSATIGSVTRQCHSEILSGWISSWYFKSELSEFKAFFNH